MTLILEARGTYATRTRENAALADITIAFALTFNTAGERLTRAAAGDKWLGIYLTLPSEVMVDAIVTKAQRFSPPVCLNIAGNGLYTLRGKMSQENIDAWIYKVLHAVHACTPIGHVRSGGQTGVDEAGIKAGLALGIPCAALLPKGYLIRTVEGFDRCCTETETRARLTPEPLLL